MEGLEGQVATAGSGQVPDGRGRRLRPRRKATALGRRYVEDAALGSEDEASGEESEEESEEESDAGSEEGSEGVGEGASGEDDWGQGGRKERGRAGGRAGNARKKRRRMVLSEDSDEVRGQQVDVEMLDLSAIDGLDGVDGVGGDVTQTSFAAAGGAQQSKQQSKRRLPALASAGRQGVQQGQGDDQQGQGQGQGLGQGQGQFQGQGQTQAGQTQALAQEQTVGFIGFAPARTWSLGLGDDGWGGRLFGDGTLAAQEAVQGAPASATPAGAGGTLAMGTAALPLSLAGVMPPTQPLTIGGMGAASQLSGPLTQVIGAPYSVAGRAGVSQLSAPLAQAHGAPAAVAGGAGASQPAHASQAATAARPPANRAVLSILELLDAPLGPLGDTGGGSTAGGTAGSTVGAPVVPASSGALRGAPSAAGPATAAAGIAPGVPRVAAAEAPRAGVPVQAPVLGSQGASGAPPKQATEGADGRPKPRSLADRVAALARLNESKK